MNTIFTFLTCVIAAIVLLGALCGFFGLLFFIAIFMIEHFPKLSLWLFCILVILIVALELFLGVTTSL